MWGNGDSFTAFLSTLSLRRATPQRCCVSRCAIISIHALLAESDAFYHCRYFERMKFLSTLSLRRATKLFASNQACQKHFYPRSPCGERRDSSLHSSASCSNFYPRSPCGERHGDVQLNCFVKIIFLSTLSLRRATVNTTRTETAHENFYPRSPCGERRRRSVKLFRQNYISIHALLAESDQWEGMKSLSEIISIHALLAESDPGQSGE